MTNNYNLSIRISEELDKSLSYIAKKFDRSKAYITKKALQDFILEAMEDIEDEEDAVKRLNNPNRKLYTSEEVDKMMIEKYGV